LPVRLREVILDQPRFLRKKASGGFGCKECINLALVQFPPSRFYGALEERRSVLASRASVWLRAASGARLIIFWRTKNQHVVAL